MKNKPITLLLFLFLLLTVANISYAKEFNFNTQSIEILQNGNIIRAKNGFVNSDKDQIRIKSDYFYLNKKTSILKTGKGTIFFLESGITIDADEFTYNNDLSKLDARGNVKLIDDKRKISIVTQSIYFDKKNQIIKSKTKTELKDEFGNIFNVGNFKYTLRSGIIKIEEATLNHLENNLFNIKAAFLNLDLKKLIGKDITINFNDKNLNLGTEPRIKGNTISIDDNKTLIKSGLFTSCKKNDDCPPWQLSAEEIEHDKKKKTIYYKNAWLKLYDKPVFYFPKFFHPDPTVKRQSGFLMPTFNNSASTGSSFIVPYYKVISKGSDATIKPRFFSKDKLATQLEYRGINSDLEYNMDSSFLVEKKSSTKSHLFFESFKKINLKKFDESFLNFNFQTVSNDTYLKTYKIESPLIDNSTYLTSFINLNAYRDDLFFEGNITAYEDLNKIDHDRFEFIYPSFNLVKDITLSDKSNIPGDFTFDSSGFIKNYNTNIFEEVLINNLIFSSDSLITEKGIKSDFKFLIKNVNTKADKSKKYSNKLNNKISSLLQIDSSYPLIKKIENFTHIIRPKASLKYSPNQNNSTLGEEDRRIDLNSIYNINRIATNDAVEGGASLTYGFEYNKNNSEDENIFKSEIANVIRFNENENLPNNNDLGSKTSDIFGNFQYNAHDIFKVGYNFTIDNNLDDTKYQSINTDIVVNNFVTSFEYVNENNTLNSSSYINNSTTYSFDDSKKLSYSTRINKRTKMTEFYNLMYQYRNDCLTASLEYSKDYYSDRDLTPNENIFFKLSIIPFGQISSPSLK